MLLKKYILIVALILGSLSLSAQRATDTAMLNGTWQLVRVEVKTVSETEQVLNTTVIEKVEERMKLNAFVPVFVLFGNGRYIMNGQVEQESGVYQLLKDRIVWMSVTDKEPAAGARSGRYKMPDDASLSLQLPEVYYYDNKLKTGVREVAIGYYHKINNKANSL